MTFQDKTLTCRDCGTTFVFTVRDQEFYASKGFANEPSRCPSCRAARKSGIGNGGGSTRTFRERAPREMFPAVCSSCGKETEVPFSPRSDKPVYCQECFAEQRARGAGR